MPLQQLGVQPVPYIYRNARGIKGRQVTIGQMLQDPALAVRVLDDQLKMALGQPHLFSSGDGRSCAVSQSGADTRHGGRFKKAVNQALKGDEQRYEQTRTMTRTDQRPSRTKRQRTVHDLGSQSALRQGQGRILGASVDNRSRCEFVLTSNLMETFQMDPLKPHTQQMLEAEIARLKRNSNPEGGKERVAIKDQRTLLNLDPRRILTGDVEVYDDRPRS